MLKNISDDMAAMHEAANDEIVFSNNRKVLQKCTNTAILEIDIPHGVTEIGYGAFEGCRLVQQLDVPSSVHTIGELAFANCEFLKNINLSKGVAVIGKQAFFFCKHLKSIKIPDSVTVIKCRAFDSCLELPEVTIPGSVYTIEAEAFSWCSNSHDVIIKNGVSIIDDEAFASCENLKKISLPESISEIGEAVFTSCKSLEYCKLPSGISKIANGTFYGCESLKEIIIPEAVTSIGDAAFYGCKNLTRIVIPRNVESIGAKAFAFCQNLREIIIPETVSAIGEAAFSNCTSLTAIAFPSKIKHIKKRMFAHCKNLTSISLSPKTIAIGSAAFQGCVSLCDPDLPDTIRHIGRKAFLNCTNLTAISIPAETVDIGDAAFDNTPCGEQLKRSFSQLFPVNNMQDAGCGKFRTYEIPYPLKNRRELFLDDMLSGKISGDITLRQHFPQPQPPEKSLPVGYYHTNIHEKNGLIRRYYRGVKDNYDGEIYDGHPGEYVGYAESCDGIHWEYPAAGIFPDAPANTIWCNTMETHNFVPFRDENPDCPESERYKAVAGIRECGGLSRFYSADGISWKRYDQKPFLTISDDQYVQFDSQNVCFWSETEKCYVLYYRVYINPYSFALPADNVWDNANRRAVARITSPDFKKWSKPVILKINRPKENLYVSLFAPYFRAPHFYIATPTRFFQNRGAATDITFCHTRDGVNIMRPFPGAWITPGLDPERWGNRSNYLAWQMVQTGKDEISLYHIKSQVRYTIRLDGFASLHADCDGGIWESIPLIFAPGKLECNIATSAGGSFRVGILNAAGEPIPGFSLNDCKRFYGDNTAMTPLWRGGECPPLQAGDTFRLQFEMIECDLFSFCFAPPLQ